MPGATRRRDGSSRGREGESQQIGNEAEDEEEQSGGRERKRKEEKGREEGNLTASDVGSL
jgi:hypothetical protein